MLNPFDTIQSQRTADNTQKTKVNRKILCILEGKEELNYIFNVFKIFGYSENCDQLSNKVIKIAWGKDGKPEKINNCNFQGGSHKDLITPKPAKESFEFFKRKEFSNIDAVIIMFDGDKDTNKEVENYFTDELKKIDLPHKLLVSDPCFESTLIDFCMCGDCRNIINNIPISEPLCKKYRNDDGDKKKSDYCYNSLSCLSKYKATPSAKVTASALITFMKPYTLTHLNNSNSKIAEINTIIKDFYP